MTEICWLLNFKTVETFSLKNFTKQMNTLLKTLPNNKYFNAKIVAIEKIPEEKPVQQIKSYVRTDVILSEGENVQDLVGLGSGYIRGFFGQLVSFRKIPGYKVHTLDISICSEFFPKKLSG